MLYHEAQRGVGMLEFLVALMIFSMGITGLLSAQLVAKKTIIEAGQRSMAIALARDILELLPWAIKRVHCRVRMWTAMPHSAPQMSWRLSISGSGNHS